MRSARVLAPFAVIVGLAAVAPASATAKECGSFELRDREVLIEVTAYGPLKCGTATRILKDYHRGRGLKRHGGTNKSETYYTLKGWPGWRCGTAAGGGACYRGSKSASWQSFGTS